MPDIEMAPETATCYMAVVDGVDTYFHSEEQIEYMGNVITGQQLYDLLTGQ